MCGPSGTYIGQWAVWKPGNYKVEARKLEHSCLNGHSALQGGRGTLKTKKLDHLSSRHVNFKPFGGHMFIVYMWVCICRCTDIYVCLTCKCICEDIHIYTHEIRW